jgi:hypothetical protein
VEAQCQSLLFYCKSRWLTEGEVVARVYNLQEGVALFLEEGSLDMLKIFAKNILFLSVL